MASRELLELIEAVLSARLGTVVADVIDKTQILECLLEEYFYGGSFQDEFYEALSQLKVPTLQIEYLRKEILGQIASQIRTALGDIVPCRQYSFVMTQNGDLRVTETPPRPLYRLKSA